MILEKINQYIWCGPALALILCVGAYLTVRTGFSQFKMFPKAMGIFMASFRKRKSNSGTTPFRALCTALAATVGTGNIAGVAGAISIGGPGSVFWMWVAAVLGMVIKFAEAVWSVQYRQRNQVGEYIGGPMYMIRNGMGTKWKWLAGLYAFFGVVAAFGVGNSTQINTAIAGINSVLTAYGGKETQLRNLSLGILFAVTIGLVLLGGIKRIGIAAETLVPVASLIYIALGIGIIIIRFKEIPSVFLSIVTGAFQPKAVTGGVIGSCMKTISVGISRGVFTNEAGMGTAGIAHSAANVKHPVEQGLMGIMEVFIDTVVICTITAFVILCSGVQISYGIDTGAELTAQAFSAVYGNWTKIFLAVAITCFALATVLGWGLYGIRCAEYLFGNRSFAIFVGAQIIMTILGAVLSTKTVWLLAEMVNGLMAIPNLIAVTCLTSELIKLLSGYRAEIKLGSKIRK